MAALVIGIAATAGSALAAPVFFDNFESGNLGLWTGKPGSATSGQIVITHFANVLNAGKAVEDEMALAQKEAEALAQRIT
jgi:hypothetical protein